MATKTTTTTETAAPIDTTESAAPIRDMTETVEKIALANVVKSAELRAAKKSLDAGKYNVSRRYIVDIVGTVNKGDDYEQTPVHKFPKNAMLAFVLKRSGVTRDATIAAMRDFFATALREGGSLGDALTAETDELNQWIETIQDELYADLPKQTMAGKVTAKLNVEISDE